MKKVLNAIIVAITMFVMCSFSTAGPGDGKTSCQVYGADGYTATVTYRVITLGSNGSLTWNLELNKPNTTGKTIYVVVQLRNANGCVIESETAHFDYCKNCTKSWGEFETRGSKGEAYYVTINSASCE